MNNETETEKQDVIIVGSTRELYNNLGVKTLHLQNVMKNIFPDLKVQLYDVLAPDKERVALNAKNYIFLPWVETIDINWCTFFQSLDGMNKKFLYTDNYNWFNTQKHKLLTTGFNLENIFDIIAFSSRDNMTWWNDRQYRYWGPVLDSAVYEEVEDMQYNTLFVDALWPTEWTDEPYNASRVLHECMPIIKEKHPDVKIITQKTDVSWADEVLPSNIPYAEMLEYYRKIDAYILSHNEVSGMAQFDALMSGRKIVTNKNFSNASIFLAGGDTFELWSFEDGNQSFIDSVELCLKPYDKPLLQSFAKGAFSADKFATCIKEDLWDVEFDRNA